MNKGLNSSTGRMTGPLLVVGWIVLVGLGIALVYFGFFRPAGRSPEPTAAATLTGPTATLQPLPTAPPTAAPTPAATATSLPELTSAAPTDAPVVPRVLVDEEVNVRSGPSTDYTRLGSLPAGSEARVTGRSGDWWQIDFNGTPAYVYSQIVTAVDTDGVPEVQAPAAPTAAPAANPTATTVPATAAPSAGAAPTSETRGLVVNAYSVEGAPGPYGVEAPIWFNMDITNPTGGEIKYLALGTQVEETGQLQKSYFAVPPAYPSFVPGQRFTHRDAIKIPNPGNYRLWLVIQFDDGVGVRLYGPVAVTVQ